MPDSDNATSIEARLSELEATNTRLDAILTKLEERNRRVELDKAWETSILRAVCICLLTYIAACSLILLIGTHHPWLAALIPAACYLMSTQTLPHIKEWWGSKRRT